MSEIELLECPFCGGAAHTNWVRDGRMASCGACYASGPSAYHGPVNLPAAETRARTAWNTRAADPIRAQLIAALEDCVNAMYADNPADGWKEIIDNARAALTAACGKGEN